jgi:hypothetical protein
MTRVSLRVKIRRGWKTGYEAVINVAHMGKLSGKSLYVPWNQKLGDVNEKKNIRK